MTSVTTKILMNLIDEYAQAHLACGPHSLSETTALARKLVEGGIEALVKAASPPLFDMSKGIPPATARTLPVIDPSLLEVGK